MDIMTITNTIFSVTKDVFKWINNTLSSLGNVGEIAKVVLVVGIAWYVAKNVIGTLLIVIIAFLLYFALISAGGII